MIKIIYGNCTYNFQYDNKNLQKVMENDIGELHMFIMYMFQQVSSNDRCKMFYEYTETLKKKNILIHSYVWSKHNNSYQKI